MVKIVIVGSGIAGVSCTEELFRLQQLGYSGDSHQVGLEVTLVATAVHVTRATVIQQITRTLQELDVEQTTQDWLSGLLPGLKVVTAVVERIDTQEKILSCQDGTKIRYDKLCIATGARPQLFVKNHPLILGIRDTESVEVLRQRLTGSRRVAIVGNGGVAMELVEAIDSVDVVWAIKHGYIGNTFLDDEASAFILPEVSRIRYSVENSRESANDNTHSKQSEDCVIASHLQYNRANRATSATSAVGPDWIKDFEKPGSRQNSSRGQLTVEFNAQVTKIMDSRTQSTLWSTSSPSDEHVPTHEPSTETVCHDGEWPLVIHLSNGKVYECDLVVCAIGVTPNTEFAEGALVKSSLEPGGGGAIIVNGSLQTPQDPYIYAAGDCCEVQSDAGNISDTWFQMRLWSQARQMGRTAAQSMLHAELEGGLDMEMFAHVTHFFGLKVVLLGLFNGQTLGFDQATIVKRVHGEVNPGNQHQVIKGNGYKMSVEVLTRTIPGKEFVRVLVVGGRVKGAMLIGETELEETLENLILSRLDVSALTSELLDPEIDIGDFFD